MTVNFRDARREDVPVIVSLLADDFLGATRDAAGGEGGGDADDAYFAAFDLIEVSAHNRLIVAESDGKVAGTLQLTLLPGLSRHGMLRAQIEAVRVAGWTRGQGIGRQMISWAVDEARAAGCGLVQLTSDKRRADAIRFYQGLGFEATHEGFKLPLLPKDRGNGSRTDPAPATRRTLTPQGWGGRPGSGEPGLIVPHAHGRP